MHCMLQHTFNKRGKNNKRKFTWIMTLWPCIIVVCSPPNRLLRSDSPQNCRNQLWISPPSQNMIPLGWRKLLQGSNITHPNSLLSRFSQYSQYIASKFLISPSINHAILFHHSAQHKEDIPFLCSTIIEGSSSIPMLLIVAKKSSLCSLLSRDNLED